MKTISTKIVLMLLAVVLVAVAGWAAKDYLLVPLPEIPQVDLTTANVSVATLTNETFDEVKRQPRSGAAWGKYGEVLMAHEWNSEALKCFEVASTISPKEMRWPYLSGVILDRRDPAEAVKRYEQAKSIDPNYAPLFTRLGSSLQRLNRIQDAEDAYRKAADLNKQEPQPLIGLARLASARNQWQNAVDLLDSAVKLAPTNREALVELTRARLVLGTNQTLSREAQAALISGEKYQPMPDPILQSINDHENASHIAAMKADALASGNDPQKAAEAFVELIKKRPDLARPRINLATIYMSQNQFPLALVTLRELVRLFPEDPMGHLLLSYSLQATQASAEARKELEEAIRLKPDYAEAHFALAMVTEQEGDLDKAIAAYRDAVQSNGRYAQARTALGLALMKQGKLDEAIRELTAAVRLSPGDRVPQSYLEKAIAERKEAKAATDK